MNMSKTGAELNNGILRSACRFLGAILLCMQPISSGAQMIDYAVEDQAKSTTMMLGVSLLDFNLGVPTFSLGGGADFDVFTRRFSGEAAFRFAYLDMKRNMIRETNSSENKLHNYFDFRLGGRFHFANKIGEVKMSSNIGYKTDGATTTTTYLPVMVPSQKIKALHFGFQRYNMALKKRDPNIGSVGAPSPVIAENGVAISEFSSGTNITAGMIYAGISFIDIMQADVHIGAGTWKYNWYRDIYFDFLYAPFVTVEDIVIGGVPYNVQCDDCIGFETNAFGGRFGYSTMSRNVFIKYEMGWLPGNNNRFFAGFFTQASLGFSLVRGSNKVVRKPW